VCAGQRSRQSATGVGVAVRGALCLRGIWLFRVGREELRVCLYASKTQPESGTLKKHKEISSKKKEKKRKSKESQDCVGSIKKYK
jgi:hypothetical protein